MYIVKKQTKIYIQNYTKVHRTCNATSASIYLPRASLNSPTLFEGREQEFPLQRKTLGDSASIMWEYSGDLERSHEFSETQKHVILNFKLKELTVFWVYIQNNSIPVICF